VFGSLVGEEFCGVMLELVMNIWQSCVHGRVSVSRQDGGGGSGCVMGGWVEDVP
jgi:hypothetical protein